MHHIVRPVRLHKIKNTSTHTHTVPCNIQFLLNCLLWSFFAISFEHPNRPPLWMLTLDYSSRGLLHHFCECVRIRPIATVGGGGE